MRSTSFRCNINNIRQLPDCSIGFENYNSASEGSGFGSDPNERATRDVRERAAGCLEAVAHPTCRPREWHGPPSGRCASPKLGGSEGSALLQYDA
jgi:hypothetical protein